MTQLIDSSAAKAERLTLLRKLAKLDRNAFAQMAGVSVFTYKGWENARFGGIPLKRASILIDALQSEGIKSSAEWIIDGAGEPPKKILSHQLVQFKEALADTTQAQTPEAIESLRIKAELEFFCNNNDWGVLSLTVPDDAMSPYFLQEDLIAGVKIASENFEETIGLNCIVRTKNNKVMLRQVQKGKTKELFTLLCLNPNSKQQIILQDVELIDIAPVIWIRKNASALMKISR